MNRRIDVGQLLKSIQDYIFSELQKQPHLLPSAQQLNGSQALSFSSTFDQVHADLVQCHEAMAAAQLEINRCDILLRYGMFRAESSTRPTDASDSTSLAAQPRLLLDRRHPSYQRVVAELSQSIVSEAQVVFVTLAGAGLRRLSELRHGFDAMIIGQYHLICAFFEISSRISLTHDLQMKQGRAWSLLFWLRCSMTYRTAC